MKKIIISTAIAAVFLSVQSCNSTDFDQDVADIKVTNGDADFSRYIALGNSLTSGYRDGALYIDAQNESYPNIIAQQMKLAGGGDFKLPLMADNNGGIVLGANIIQPTKLYIQSFAKGAPVISKVNAVPTTSLATPLSGSFGNMGVPGAKSFHLVAEGYGNLANVASGKANPYFVRFASSASTSVLKDAVAQKPTFFSLWIGNNDVLSYATSGGVGTNQTGNYNAATYGSNDITDPKVLAGSIKAIVEGMKSAGASKGVIANIPSVTDIPFFTTIPYNPVPLTKENAAVINGGLGRLTPILKVLKADGRLQTLKEGQNPVLIKDESLKDLSKPISFMLKQSGIPAELANFLGDTFGQARHATSEDLILLTTKAEIGTPVTLPSTIPATYANMLNKHGITYPLDDKYVLTKAEIEEIKATTTAYNAAIKSLADEYNLAFVDANAKMVELGKNSGIKWDGVNYSAKFITGGAFSLDGVHLTGRGYAIIGNEFIKAINAKYNSTLPQVNPNKYSGVTFPK